MDQAEFRISIDRAAPVGDELSVVTVPPSPGEDVNLVHVRVFGAPAGELNTAAQWARYVARNEAARREYDAAPLSSRRGKAAPGRPSTALRAIYDEAFRHTTATAETASASP